MEALLDTSWTLHHISKSSAAYHKLFTSNTTQNHLSRYFERLTQYITTRNPEYKDDFNDETEKLGSLRDIKYTINLLPNLPSPSPLTTTSKHTHLIQLQLRYQNSTFTFILHTPHLLLSKATTPQTKLITTFLSEIFNVEISPLKLPNTLLPTSLHNYISTLNSHQPPPTPSLAAEIRASILKSAIGTLKLTISFSGPVSPHLRTLDLSIPYETVDTLVSKAKSQSSSNDNDNGFMHQLAEHIHLQTGLKLPLTPPSIREVNGQSESEKAPSGRSGSVASDVASDIASGAPLRLSKMAAAAFAISIEGRLRFAAKAIDNAVEHEDLITAANMGMLDDIVQAVIENDSTE